MLPLSRQDRNSPEIDNDRPVKWVDQWICLYSWAWPGRPWPRLFKVQVPNRKDSHNEGTAQQLKMEAMLWTQKRQSACGTKKCRSKACLQIIFKATPKKDSGIRAISRWTRHEGFLHSGKSSESMNIDEPNQIMALTFSWQILPTGRISARKWWAIGIRVEPGQEAPSEIDKPDATANCFNWKWSRVWYDRSGR